MPDSENIRVNEHRHALVAIDSRTSIDAAASSVGATYSINLKGLFIAMSSIAGAEAHLQKGGVWTVDVLQIQLASHIIKWFIVSVFAASVLMVAGENRQNFLGICQRLEQFHALLQLLHRLEVCSVGISNRRSNGI